MFWKCAQPSWDESIRNQGYGLMVSALVIANSFLTVSYFLQKVFLIRICNTNSTGKDDKSSLKTLKTSSPSSNPDLINLFILCICPYFPVHIVLLRQNKQKYKRILTDEPVHLVELLLVRHLETFCQNIPNVHAVAVDRQVQG